MTSSLTDARAPGAGTTTIDQPLLAVLNGERRDPPPMWLMRQAGRYLPEYRALRAIKGGFLDMAYDPEAASEITLQPLKRFAFDGAILFSDILIVPHAIGQELTFVAGEGPRLAPPLSDASLEGLKPVLERLAPIWATVRGSRPRSLLGRRFWALPVRRGRSRLTWSPVKAAASRPKRGRWRTRIRANSPRSSSGSR